MGIEGAVELGFSKELAEAAHTSAEARRQLYTSLVEAAHERGGALSVPCSTYRLLLLSMSAQLPQRCRC